MGCMGREPSDAIIDQGDEIFRKRIKPILPRRVRDKQFEIAGVTSRIRQTSATKIIVGGSERIRREFIIERPHGFRSKRLEPDMVPDATRVCHITGEDNHQWKCWRMRGE
jgi:hypothetical protein